MEFSKEGAQAELDRLRAVLDGLGLKYVDVEPRMFGVAAAVAFGETDFAVLSVVSGNQNYVYVTAGALREVARDKLAVLEVCNDYVAQNSEVPVYLHDAEIGWDVLAQVAHPVQLYVDVPAYFNLMLRAVPNAAEKVRAALSEKGIAGEPTGSVRRTSTACS